LAKKQKKKSRAARATPSIPPHQVLERLDDADRLMRKKRWVEARDLLEDLNRRYSGRPEALTYLVNVYYELHDIVNYQRACEQLVRADPHNSDAALGLAGAYLSNIRPMMALRAFQRFLERWPDHERAAEVRTTAVELQGKMAELLAELGLSDDEAGRQIAMQHEEMQAYLAQGRFREVRQAAEAILRREPRFAPALNNLSLAHWAEGRLDQAIDAARRVLAFEPDNIHALSNVIRFTCASGRSDEAQPYAERLKASTAPAWDRWVKKAEGLSFVGDDEGVLEVLRQAQPLDRQVVSGHSRAYLTHLAAVAALRLGREDEARRYWKQALGYQPGFELARENLADLRRPAGERNAPWPFPLDNWISPKALKDLLRFVESAAQAGRESGVKSGAQRFLREYPEIIKVMPILLERGDGQARELAMLLADTLRTPELLEPLRDLALSQHGPDQLRHKAAQLVSEAGLLPPGPTRLWLGGEWHESLLLAFEVSGEPQQKHKPQVQQWAQEAVQALHQRDAHRARQLLERALASEPDAPDLLQNLSAVYSLEGHDAEAEALVRQIHERHPDYLFARTALAQQCIEHGEFEEARRLLEPLMHRKRLHFSEFYALCGVNVQLHLAEGHQDGARSWLNIWESVNPESPTLQTLRLQVEGPRRSLGLLNRSSGGKKRRHHSQVS